MKIKFTEPYGDDEAGYKQGHEYQFIDVAKANRFVANGIAVQVDEDELKMVTKGKRNGIKLDTNDTKQRNLASK